MLFTKREIAKNAATAATSVLVSQSADAALDSFTEVDTDSIPVSVGTTVFGVIVAFKLAPITDHLVDRVADRLDARKARKNLKNETA